MPSLLFSGSGNRVWTGGSRRFASRVLGVNLFVASLRFLRSPSLGSSWCVCVCVRERERERERECVGVCVCVCVCVCVHYVKRVLPHAHHDIYVCACICTYTPSLPRMPI